MKDKQKYNYINVSYIYNYIISCTEFNFNKPAKMCIHEILIYITIIQFNSQQKPNDPFPKVLMSHDSLTIIITVPIPESFGIAAVILRPFRVFKYTYLSSIRVYVYYYHNIILTKTGGRPSKYVANRTKCDTI